MISISMSAGSKEHISMGAGSWAIQTSREKKEKKTAVVVVGGYSLAKIKPSSMYKVAGAKVFCKTIPNAKIEDIII